MRIATVRLPVLSLLIPVFFVVLLAPEAGLAAQTAPAVSFAAEPYVIEHISTVYSFQADGTGYRDQTVVVKVQSDAALRQLGVLTLPFASASEHVEFQYVRVRRPDGSVQETSVSDALEEPAPVTREAPFYSDLKQKELPVKSMHVGDTLEWKARTVRTVPEDPGQFWGQHSFPQDGVVLAEDVELRVPAGIHVNVWTNPRSGVTPSITVEQAEKVYRWKSANLKPTVGPAADAAKKAAETHVLTTEEETEASDGKLASIEWTSFADWAAVGAWYRSLEATRNVADASVKAKVAELTAGKTTQEEKAHALYSYVSMQIRYIGVAFGIGRYQPHTAAEVLANQYGDCKDKHTLLAAMLGAAGVPTDAVLIGSGVRFNEAVPSPEAFNHLITRAHIDGKEDWLDTTAEISPWRVLFPQLRDKPALVIPESGAAVILHTPATVPYPMFANWTVSGTLDKTLTSESSVVLTYRDDDELGLRAVLQQVTAGQYSQFVQALFTNLGFGGTTSDPEIDHVQDSSQPLTFRFHYHRVKEADWGDNRITAIFAPTSLPVVSEEHPPVAMLQLGMPRTETSTVDMHVPEHWGAELPEAVHAKSAYATCDVTYGFEKGVLHAERKLVVLQQKVPVAQWKLYKTWYDECGAGSVPYLQLTPDNGLKGGGAEPVVTVSNAEAAKLIDEANTAEKNHDPDKALELLDKAKALNPQQRNLWGTYGYRAYDLGAPNEAIEDYRKELTFHPDMTWAYGPLADELYRVGKKDEAIKTLREGVAADPTNARLQRGLVNFLYFMNQKKEAVDAGLAALKVVPADGENTVALQMALAKAEIDLGMFPDAAALLTKIIQNADTPGLKNDAAYELSETGLELGTAEAAERSALATLGDETQTWTLNESVATLKQKSSLIFASWDTLGWILYREGHLHEARALVEAAWHNRQDYEVGQHLGEIALADNDPKTSLEAYTMALARVPQSNGKIVPAYEAAAAKIRDGIGRAKKAGGKLKDFDAHTELQRMRVLKLGPGAGVNGSMEYALLISKGKVDVLKSLDKKENPRGSVVLRGASFAQMTPADSNARVVLVGYLNCIDECEFVIEP